MSTAPRKATLIRLQHLLYCNLKIPSSWLNIASLWMSHYSKWGAPGCSAVSVYFSASFFWLTLFFSCQDAFYVSIFWCCDNLKHRLRFTEEALESRRNPRLWAAQWRLSIYEWPLTAGERWTAGFSPLLFPFACFYPFFSASKPPPRVTVQRPIVRDIQPQCENQQMGNFVCIAAADVCVCVCVWGKREGWGRAKEQGIIYDRCTL